MNRLYVIGNGFDLYHGIESKYSAFGEYLKIKHPALFSTLEILVDEVDDLWADFEYSLGKLDVTIIMEEYRPDVMSESFKYSDIYGYEDEMEQQCDELTDYLKDIFSEWIFGLDIDSVEKIRLDKEAYFLNFNYTNSLEDIYQIKPSNILHIHGKADRNEVILGHGSQPAPLLNDGPDERHPFSDAESRIKGYYWRTFKDTKDIISRNESFFQGLRGITQIYVLGHSLSEIDLPYFEKICYSIDLEHTKWTVSYYQEAEYMHHYDVLCQLNISSDNICLLKMEDLSING